jgi:hypothetical protein
MLLLILGTVDVRVTPVWNTLGVIPGYIKNEVVIIGNHRDGNASICIATFHIVTDVNLVRSLGMLLDVVFFHVVSDPEIGHGGVGSLLWNSLNTRGSPWSWFSLEYGLEATQNYIDC